MSRRIIIGISGASGIVYGLRILEVLQRGDFEVHLVMSKSAEVALGTESDRKLSDVHALASVVHPAGDVGASIASGSFRNVGMIVAPCSIRSLSEIATGVTSSLLTRAADVVLKERRRLVLLVRETPLHTGHLRTMTQASELGAVIFPPVPAFYIWPNTVENIIDQTVGRVLDLFEIENDLVRRWGESQDGERPLRAFPTRRP